MRIESAGSAVSARSAPLAAAALFVLGCASSWAPRSVEPRAELQWPSPPAPAKLAYDHSLSGFSSRRGAGAALRAAAIGRTAADEGGFALPVAVAAGPGGAIAVADLGRRCVHLYRPDEQRYRRLTGARDAPLASPVALAFDDRGRLWVSDSTGRVLAFGVQGEVLRTIASAGGEPLRRPTGIAFDAARGRLYVAETLAHRIDVFDLDGDYLSSFGGRGESEGLLNFPTYLSLTPAGELLVTDAMNFRIDRFDAEGRLLGSFGRHGDGSGDFARPRGVAVDRDGVVYVADGLFDNVQLFTRKGDYLMTLGARGTGFGELWLPAGLFVDGNGRLWVCDTYNRRVQVFRITENYESSDA